MKKLLFNILLACFAVTALAQNESKENKQEDTKSFVDKYLSNKNIGRFFLVGGGMLALLSSINVVIMSKGFIEKFTSEWCTDSCSDMTSNFCGLYSHYFAKILMAILAMKSGKEILKKNKQKNRKLAVAAN